MQLNSTSTNCYLSYVCIIPICCSLLPLSVHHVYYYCCAAVAAVVLCCTVFLGIYVLCFADRMFLLYVDDLLVLCPIYMSIADDIFFAFRWFLFSRITEFVSQHYYFRCVFCLTIFDRKFVCIYAFILFNSIGWCKNPRRNVNVFVCVWSMSRTYFRINSFRVFLCFNSCIFWITYFSFYQSSYVLSSLYCIHTALCSLRT